jgi:hypothetical protein
MIAEARSEWLEAFSAEVYRPLFRVVLAPARGRVSHLIGCVKEGEQNRDVVLATRIVRRL